MNINNRIKTIRQELLNNSNKDFAIKLNISSQAVSNYVRDGYNVGREVIENILLAFPEVNANWLLTGEGDMIRKEGPAKTASPEILSESEFVAYLREENKELKEENKKLIAINATNEAEIIRLQNLLMKEGVDYKQTAS